METGYDPPEQFRTALDQLHDIVAKEVGSDDFGAGDYLPGLKVLLQSMDYDPHFTETGPPRRLGPGGRRAARPGPCDQVDEATIRASTRTRSSARSSSPAYRAPAPPRCTG